MNHTNKLLSNTWVGRIHEVYPVEQFNKDQRVQELIFVEKESSQPICVKAYNHMIDKLNVNEFIGRKVEIEVRYKLHEYRNKHSVKKAQTNLLLRSIQEVR